MSVVWQRHSKRLAGESGLPHEPKGSTVAVKDQGTSTEGEKPEGAGDGAGAGTEGEEFDKDRALETIRKLRDVEKASKATAKERDALAAKVREYEDATKTEQERMATRIKELEDSLSAKEQEVTQTKTRNAVHAKASAMGFRNPELAMRLVDPSEVTFKKNGDPENIEDLLKAIVKENPFLVPGGGADGGAGSGGSGKPATHSMNDQIRRAAGRGTST